jgi:hypothetical protein
MKERHRAQGARHKVFEDAFPPAPCACWLYSIIFTTGQPCAVRNFADMQGVNSEAKPLMNYPAKEQRCIRCHAGLVADCRCLISYSQPDSASSLDIWIPTFIRSGGLAGMTTHRKWRGIKP